MLTSESDVLNILVAPPQVNGVQTRPDTRKQEANARHLSKHVFPRQYGLPSPFDGTNKGLFVSEFCDNEAQIKVRFIDTEPKTLMKRQWSHRQKVAVKLRSGSNPL